jgi:arylsulfatase
MMKHITPFAVLMLAPVAVTGSEEKPSPASRPNIVIIVCDDLGYSDLGCYGGEIRTPNLDRLADQGTRFSQFYNCAVCNTTRAAFYTGLYPRHGAGGWLRPQMVTLGEALKSAGYQTAMVGKWHLGSTAPRRPIDRGFDEYYGLLDGCSSYFNPAKPDPQFYNGGRVRAFADGADKVTDFPKDFYATDAYSERAAEMIGRLSKEGKPFFLNVCYTAPHFPLHALPEDIARYRGKYAKGYDALRTARYERLVKLGLIDRRTTPLSRVDPKQGDFRYDYEVVPWDRLDDATRAREEARMEVYAAMVDRLDQGIGRMLSALDKSDVADNTIVFFFSDNGGCATWPRPAQEPGFFEYNKGIPVGDPRGYEFVGKGWGWAQNTPFRRHKTWTYEGGICTPMIVRWPGKVAAGKITHQPGHVVDFMPTLLELAGGKYPAEANGKPVPPMEGMSLVPILHGKTRERGPLAWSLMGNHAYRNGDWKAVYNGSAKRWELYNLAADRSETSDLAKEHPARLGAMTAAWRDWARTCGLALDP